MQNYTNQNSENIKYFLYARKSSESEDRQVNSTESQIEELEQLAEQNNIKIEKVFEEDKSAKAPGREIYNDMIARIKKGEANGIICWKVNRLARNPVDGGEISWLLQEGIIKHILTFGRSYYPTDNVLMMAVELGVANQFVKDLSTDTKRGLRKKARDGWYPGQALLGYKNTPTNKKKERVIEIDKECFNMVRKMFKMVITCKYSAARVLKIATYEWSLRRPNGKPLSRSTWYKMLSHPFYYGEFEYSGEWYKGKHKPMITKQEFDQIQIILGNKRSDKPQKNEFPFTGLLKCGECGRTVTAEHKYKKQKSGKVHHYVYYHCVAKNKSECSQGVIQEGKLLEQLSSKVLDSVEIPHDFVDWALEAIKEQNKEESASRKQILTNQRKSYNLCLKKIDNLIDMRANGELDEEEFVSKKKKLVEEKSHLHDIINNVDESVSSWLEKAEKMFSFAEIAKMKFETTEDYLLKKSIIREMCSNRFLKDQKVSVELEKPLSELQKASTFLKDQKLVVRTAENRLSKRKNAPSYDAFPTLLRDSDSNRGPID